MRLTKIKLAGFKSFVDPTTVPLPSQLIGIVGPNGCGKSNIIDCVRWVMGESSAKHLRGESMVDVIFNGSSSRKPVSQASVELIFDNRDGGLGGQYASYNEISVKRVVNRDGQSAYYLNGTRCRKRDITDVFLGTGLGPRSYAIIEQGMISRVVEARPEDLRVYLEEAAGISLYKERRRETERRIRDTRENLDRLNDLRDEVGQQAEKLKRQAEAAERYKALRVDERARRGELVALRLSRLESELTALTQVLRERETAVEGEIARQREIERDIEAVREAHSEGSDRFNEIQGRFYGLGSEIARLEQQIAHRRELREKGRRDLEANEEAVREIESGLAQDEEKLEVISRRLQELEPELERCAEGEAEAIEAAALAQEALDEWQHRWDEFTAQSAEPVQAAQVERARIEQFERRSQELIKRRERLQSELETMDLDALEAQVDELAEELEGLAEETELLTEQVEEAGTRLNELRDHHDELTDERDEQRGELSRARARLESLQTLQQAALGREGPLAKWLAERGWQENRRLAQVLDVEPGWERALEAVLGNALQAVVTDRLDDAVGALSQLESGELMLLDAAAATAAPSESRYLAARVGGAGPLAELLVGVICAETLVEAQRLRAELAPGESVVTREGVWLGRGWLRVHAGDDHQAGVLAREREIQALQETIDQIQQRLDALDASLEESEQAVLEAEEQREERQDELNELRRRQATLKAQHEHRQSRLDEQYERRARLAEDIDEIGSEIARAGTEIQEARARLDTALAQAEELDERREQLQDEKMELGERLSEMRHHLQRFREERHELSLKIESARTAQRSIEEGLGRLRSQHARLIAQREALEASLAESEDPGEGLIQERETLLEQRLAVEEELSQARSRLSESEERLRELEKQRIEADRRTQELRQGVEQARLKAQELEIRRQGELDKLSELELDYQTLLDGLPEGASEEDWQKELERIEQRIARLGAINLAAIEEYQALEERRGFLDRQHDDLVEALETLESAIRRIDRETRQRFKDTYDKVNAGMQRIFPRLFGGGQGYLELTGDDLLETGVAIMARPPGKRVTNIHLLSGGEKALTAVALVFAIFELNPSPFCMLDEVDAPLDEANVGRFCDMLVEMSPRVQFIFITHNKVTMEIAEHLTGVTMHEPGVSRLVAVDVNEAVQLAAV